MMTVRRCPFCGCFMQVQTYHYIGTYYRVAPLTTHEPDCCLWGLKLKSYRDWQSAVDAWNGRKR